MASLASALRRAAGVVASSGALVRAAGASGLAAATPSSSAARAAAFSAAGAFAPVALLSSSLSSSRRAASSGDFSPKEGSPAAPAASSSSSSSAADGAAEAAGPAGSGAADAEAAFEAWGAAVESGDWDTAWDIFESIAPVDGPEFASLYEIATYEPQRGVAPADPAAAAPGGEVLSALGLRPGAALGAGGVAGAADAAEASKGSSSSSGGKLPQVRHRVVDASGRAQATGRRKEATARVWLFPGSGRVTVNRRPLDQYFPEISRRVDVLAPLDVVNGLFAFDLMVNVRGGGPMGQAQATRHAVAQALQKHDPALRPALKVAGFLTRDARVVERKKPGRKKARKSFQWVKR